MNWRTFEKRLFAKKNFAGKLVCFSFISFRASLPSSKVDDYYDKKKEACPHNVDREIYKRNANRINTTPLPFSLFLSE